MAASMLARSHAARQPHFGMSKTSQFLFPAILCGACSSGLGPVVPETAVERQMIGLLEKFDRWDDNGDGELDLNELAMGLEGTDFKPDRIIDFYDTNGNQRISLREAQAGYSRADEAGLRIQERKDAEGGTR
jgi:hypothetical protein